MSLVACPECEQQVSTSAYRCPHCGYPLNRGRRTLIVLLVAAGVLVVSLVLIRFLNLWRWS